MKKLLLLVMVLGAFVACVPFPVPTVRSTAYRMRGRAIDVTSGSPITDVRVSYKGRDDLAFFSDAEGRFDIPAQRDLVLLTVVTVDPVYRYPTPRPMPRTVVLTRKGYATHTIDLMSYYIKKSIEQKPPYIGPAFIVELGDVKMTPSREEG